VHEGFVVGGGEVYGSKLSDFLNYFLRWYFYEYIQVSGVTFDRIYYHNGIRGYVYFGGFFPEKNF
jgi:hypothetical protein